jgi:peptidoglycan/LPS O-acetylase OafA/YrhL
MILDGRIWQFLLGFLAHFAYNAKLIDWNISNGNKNSRVMRILVEIRNAAPIVLLFLTLTFDILDVMDHQIQRLVVVVLTALIVSIRNTNQTLLSSDILVHFGDVSYSTYLAHYPIFIMDRYLDNELYSGNKETGHISG